MVCHSHISGEQLNQLLDRFGRIVEQECGEEAPAAFVRQRLDDGIALENGNFHAGLKLNPKVRV